jgi:hypothetical protein
LPPQRPSPSPGNGRPGENVRENYRAVVARAAGFIGNACLGQDHTASGNDRGFRRSSTSWRTTSSSTVQTSDTAARAGTRRRG